MHSLKISKQWDRWFESCIGMEVLHLFSSLLVILFIKIISPILGLFHSRVSQNFYFCKTILVINYCHQPSEQKLICSMSRQRFAHEHFPITWYILHIYVSHKCKQNRKTGNVSGFMNLHNKALTAFHLLN